MGRSEQAGVGKNADGSREECRAGFALRGTGRAPVATRARIPHELMCHMSRNLRCGTKVWVASSVLGDASADWR
jgi:hypothetical protein